MRVSRKEMEHSHDRIVDAASRLVRKAGIEQTGVKDAMLAAGLTHGGFYRHFASKDELVAEALDAAFDQMAALLDEGAGGTQGEAAFNRQRDFYLSDRHLTQPELGCPAAALGSDIGRGTDDLKARFGAGLDRMIKQLAESFPGLPAERRERAYREFALMAGAVILARASDPASAARLLDAVRAGTVGARRRGRKTASATLKGQ